MFGLFVCSQENLENYELLQMGAVLFSVCMGAAVSSLSPQQELSSWVFPPLIKVTLYKEA